MARQRGGEIEYSITLREKGWLRLDSIIDYIEEHRRLRDIYELDVEYDNVKLEVELGDRQRTLDLGHPDRFKASFDVTQNVAEGPDGFPTFESISRVGRGILTELAAGADILR